MDHTQDWLDRRGIFLIDGISILPLAGPALGLGLHWEYQPVIGGQAYDVTPNLDVYHLHGDGVVFTCGHLYPGCGF